MMPSKEKLLKNYNLEQNFRIPCFLEGNPKLTKLLTGQGSKLAKEIYSNYVSFNAELQQEDKFKIYKLATQINDNPDVAFFTCVANGNMTDIHVEVWGSEDLITAAGLLDGAGDKMLAVVTNTDR